MKGRVALLTGAQRGIGLAIARLLASASAHVVLNDLHAEGVDACVTALKADGLSVSTSVCDVTQHDHAAHAIDAIVEQHGRLDVLVNNADIQNRRSFVDYRPDEWDAIQQVHVRGAFKVSQAAAKVMIRSEKAESS